MSVSRHYNGALQTKWERSSTETKLWLWVIWLYKRWVFRHCLNLSSVGALRTPSGRLFQAAGFCDGERKLAKFQMSARGQAVPWAADRMSVAIHATSYLFHCAQRVLLEPMQLHVCPKMIFVLVWRHVTFRLPPSFNIQTMISLERVVWSTSCLILGWGFHYRRIKWRYFRFDQIQDGGRDMTRLLTR